MYIKGSFLSNESLFQRKMGLRGQGNPFMIGESATDRERWTITRRIPASTNYTEWLFVIFQPAF